MDRGRIKGLRFPSFYIEDYDRAVEFYSKVFGSPDTDQPEIKGWKLGDTWLTLFPSKAGASPGENPRNAEFAIEVSSPDEVDHLRKLMLDAGASGGWEPQDTEMYVPMRFAFVEDPVGIRVDIYCLLPA